MTATELKEHLKYLNWSQAELGRRVKASNNTVTRWVKTGKISGAVAVYVELKVKVKRLAE